MTRPLTPYTIVFYDAPEVEWPALEWFLLGLLNLMSLVVLVLRATGRLPV